MSLTLFVSLYGATNRQLIAGGGISAGGGSFQSFTTYRSLMVNSPDARCLSKARGYIEKDLSPDLLKELKSWKPQNMNLVLLYFNDLNSRDIQKVFTQERDVLIADIRAKSFAFDPDGPSFIDKSKRHRVIKSKEAFTLHAMSYQGKPTPIWWNLKRICSYSLNFSTLKGLIFDLALHEYLRHFGVRDEQHSGAKLARYQKDPALISGLIDGRDSKGLASYDHMLVLIYDSLRLVFMSKASHDSSASYPKMPAGWERSILSIELLEDQSASPYIWQNLLGKIRKAGFAIPPKLLETILGYPRENPNYIRAGTLAYHLASLVAQKDVQARAPEITQNRKEELKLNFSTQQTCGYMSSQGKLFKQNIEAKIQDCRMKVKRSTLEDPHTKKARWLLVEQNNLSSPGLSKGQQVWLDTVTGNYLGPVIEASKDPADWSRSDCESRDGIFGYARFELTKRTWVSYFDLINSRQIESSGGWRSILDIFRPQGDIQFIYKDSIKRSIESFDASPSTTSKNKPSFYICVGEGRYKQEARRLLALPIIEDLIFTPLLNRD